MPLPTIPSGNVASALPSGYDVDNSCRFDGSSAYMHKTLGSTSNQRTFTLSAWVKRCGLGAANQIISMDRSGPRTEIAFNSDNKIACNFNPSGSSWSEFYSVSKFIDISAWYHVVVSVDTTQSTDTDRLKIYVNGSLISFTGSLPSQNFDTGWNVSGNVQAVGRYENGSSGYFNGYMAEVCWIDGTAYAASDFGEFDSDSPQIWKPKDVSGLTFGTHGFYLDFKDSSNLGNDANGGTDLTEVNLAAIDQTTDTPTNNFATLNSLDVEFSSHNTWSEGNLKATNSNPGGSNASNKKYFGFSTLGVSSGKWYVEVKCTSIGSEDAFFSVGIIKNREQQTSLSSLGQDTNSYRYYASGGQIEYNASTLSTGATYTTNDIVGIYLDLDNATIDFYKNGSAQGSQVTSVPTGEFYLFGGHGYRDPVAEFNFGNPTFTISSSNSDDNGYGSFEYSPNISTTKYYALCTKNIGEFGG